MAQEKASGGQEAQEDFLEEVTKEETEKLK